MENSHQLVLVITQNLHKSLISYRKKNREQRNTSIFLYSLLFLFTSIVLSAQEKETQADKNNLKFQDLFFDALTQKAIHNYDNAIESLEECNELIPDKTAVLFELSKNYLYLNRKSEAIEYADKALEQNPNNIWVLEHLVRIYKKKRDFTKAIETQEKIIKNNPKKKGAIVYLFLQNKNKKAALKTLKELEKAKMLNPNLREIKHRLSSNTKTKISAKIVSKSIKNPADLINEFKEKKSFNTLKKLLLKLDKSQNKDLLKYSETGLNLYPAQPFVYLINGRALNKNKNFKKAIISLENGIDFIIDDHKITQEFYKELIIAYKGLGNKKEEIRYRNKLQ